NAILDPILIFGLDMELTGAALASVAARLTIGATALLPLFRHHGGIELPKLGPLLRDLRPIFVIAVPAILTQLATPIGQAFVTRSMAQFGEAAVAGMAITARLTPVAFGVLFALSGAIGPIIGQNFGAEKLDRVRLAYREGLLFCLVVVIFVSIVLYVLRDPIADLFDAEDEALTLVYLFCGPLALAFFFNGAIFVSNAAFNNLGHPFYSTWINWGRHTLGTIPTVLLGAALFGAPGVLIGQAVGGVIFAALSAWLAFRVMNADLQPSEKPHFAREGRLMSLLHHRR
ncbi:MAG: MATE family efflux transporter, partial [Pseudomonadota bacterium]